MLTLSEYLPNPVGSDSAGEWVEIFNPDSAPINLGGWRLQVGSGKSAKLTGVIDSGQYLVVPRKDFKLALVNSNGSLSLINPIGVLVDKLEFVGNAPEGKSVAQIDGSWVFITPTPGQANSVPTLGLMSYPLGPLNPPVSSKLIDGVGLMLATALLLSLGAIVLIRAHDHLSQLFFGPYLISLRPAGNADRETSPSP